MLTVHECGKENKNTVVLFHPPGVWWDIFESVIPPPEKAYHLVIPAMPGHDPDQPRTDYTSVEGICADMTAWLTSRGLRKADFDEIARILAA